MANRTDNTAQEAGAHTGGTPARSGLASAAQTGLRFAVRKPLGLAGALLLALMTFVAIFAPFLTVHDPYESYSGARQVAPQLEFWFGTDNLARDIYSRLVIGTRVSMLVGFSVVIISVAVGTLIGLVSGYLGGWVDNTLQRIMDVILAIPALFLALSFMAVLGPSVANVIASLSIVSVPVVARVVRSTVISLRESMFVEAARAIGAGDVRITLLHILPNSFAPIIVMASVLLGLAIVSEATLSFLGVGIPFNIPSWGGMLGGEAKQYVRSAPWMLFFPGLALSLTVLGINLLGDALRDTLDPRLRGLGGRPI